MLDTEEKYDDDRRTKSYPKRKLLPEFDDEAVPLKNNTASRPDKPLLGKGLLVAHQFCLLMAHYWCATSTTPLVFFTNGAPLVRH